MSPASFDYIRTLLADLSAITLDDEKRYLVEARLLPVARRAGLSSIDELVKQLRATPGHPLGQQVVDAMTTNETSFFRDQVPFETLRTVILPDLLARRSVSRQLNIWSAACASGQEPYSIAMLLREHFPQLRSLERPLAGHGSFRRGAGQSSHGAIHSVGSRAWLAGAVAAEVFSSHRDRMAAR